MFLLFLHRDIQASESFEDCSEQLLRVPFLQSQASARAWRRNDIFAKTQNRAAEDCVGHG